MTLVPDAQRQLASLPLAIVLLAPGQTIASVNPAAEQFFGQSLRRLVGRSLLETMHFAEPRLVMTRSCWLRLARVFATTA